MHLVLGLFGGAAFLHMFQVPPDEVILQPLEGR